ncbi:hypothetical protein KDE13_04275 [Campylobacter sp. faydin G-140]|uniref:hypothetical protein n=1 Tax=Campylobacter anatolicus TaxID=2829105 RepID=UPI001B9D5C80|nr:hypothetical protein [Campylobacter anatolicus]MBR8465577.1 hypothetical protein [Campylobacter anatolicus]
MKRKCAMEGDIYIIDLEPFRDLNNLLVKVSNNIGQIVKRVNQIGVIYKNDIKKMQGEIENIAKEI